MNRTRLGLLMGKKSTWNIVDEKGNVLAEFERKTTAEHNIPSYKLTKHEELKVVEVEHGPKKE